MSMKGMVVAAVALLLTAPAAVTAQTVGGNAEGAGLRYEMPPSIGGAVPPQALRDSLAFAAMKAGAGWLRPDVPEWRGEALPAWRPDGLRAAGGTAAADGGARFAGNPYSFDFHAGGTIAAWETGALTGSGFRTTMPVLMSAHNATLGVVQSVGNATMTVGAAADRYYMRGGMATAFSIGGALTYSFSDNTSATVFGRYTTNDAFRSMAAMPYMGTSAYGGYITFMGETLGVDLGVERHYDTFARQWVTYPIITPKVKVSERFVIDLPVGTLVKEIFDNAVNKNSRRTGPTIMPDAMPMPGAVPFGAPEMPR